ncbi:MAG TPA: MMPL family transporter [Actinomycetota bacterium]|jgi:RND superfamily putative drug exporter|nr:MMPL family transporter [Actinomycetota bacterium]
MRINPESFARASSRHPWRTVIVWVVVLGGAIGLVAGGLFGDALTNAIDFTNEPEAKEAARLVEERLRGEEPDSELVLVASGTATVEDPAYASYVGALQEKIQALGDDVVTSVGSYLTEDGPVSESRRAVLLPVLMTTTDEDVLSDDAKLLDEAVASVDRPEGFETHVAGPATLFNEFQEIIEEDIQTGEGVGSLVALIVLVVVLGAVVAGFVPILLAAFSIAIAMGATALAGLAFDFSFFVQNMITMIGLAVGIDYSLFIMARYREERLHGREKEEAIGRAGATANRAVFFSGMTVVLALLGLLLVPNTIFRSLAGGAIFVVLVAVAASMTLLPAILSLMGDKVNALRVRSKAGRVEAGTGFWDRATRLVMGRPVISFIAGAGLLVVLAVPYFSIHTGTSGVSTLPDDIDSKRAFVLLEENFAGGLSEPAQVVIDGDIAAPDVQSAIDELTATVTDDERFAAPSPLEVNEAGDLAVLAIPLRGDIYEDASVQALRDLRGDYVPGAFADANARVLVGGETAFNVDFFNQSDTYMPIVFVFVLGLSFLLLTVVFRSVVLPVKAILMNLLSVGAAYGMVVMFFQQGVGPAFVKDIASALNFIQVESIEAWLPLFLFAVLFGLSMDYHVFLLTRIREHYDLTGDNTGSVAYGLRTTAGIITGAALIMVAVFGGFAAGRLAPLQQMGFGLAVAVFLDATIVRTILVPSAMKLLGRANWYLPRWLEWLPKLDVERHEAAERWVEIPDAPAELVEAGRDSGKRPGDFG